MYIAAMPRTDRNKPIGTGFGSRLSGLRQARGLSQRDLAKALGVKQPTVSYYESQDGHPQADVLTKLAKVLEVTVDELLGTPGNRLPLPTERPGMRRLWDKFRILAELPEKDQQVVLHYLKITAEARGIKTA